LFISYSHNDESYIENFKKHISPLKSKGLINEWYDRHIKPGEQFQKEINKNLENSDVICLFISPNFLASSACIAEKKKAFKLKAKRNVLVVPIILNSCLWLEDEKLSEKLAIPEDGKPIETYDNKDTGWVEVASKIGDLIEDEIGIRNIKLRNDFNEFLRSPEMFEKSHPIKDKLLLNDIFISPDLEEINIKNGKEKDKNFDYILNNPDRNDKIVIVGENLSGKTTLCKKIYLEFFKKNYLPVYLNDKKNDYNGNLKNKVAKAFINQYETESE